MAETRRYPAQWLGVYKASTNRYDHGTHPIRVGGSADYNTFIGFSTQVKNDINSSKTAPRIFLSMNVLDTGEFDVGLHKESSNKATGSLPYYRYAGLHPTLSASSNRRRIELTSLSGALDVYENINSYKEALDKGYKGVVLYGGSDYASATGATRDKNEVYLEIEGSWNTAPSKPELTFPSGGETLLGEQTITWTPSTDNEISSSKLKYQVAIDDGKWNYLPLTSAGVTSLTVDLSDYNETSTARVAVRATDGSLYSSWDYIDAVFTITKNKAPSMPTALKPSGGAKLDRTEYIIFQWRHNDSDRQSRYNLRYRKQGGSFWVERGTDSAVPRYIMPPGTLQKGTYEWQVQTFDEGGKLSPWSRLEVFYAADKSNMPEFVTPQDGGLISDPKPTIMFISVAQAQYEFEVLSGGSLVHNVSEETTNKAFTLRYELTNNTNYTFRLRIKNRDGLWSDWNEINVTTSFVTPKEAELITTVDEERGAINIEITNPDGNKLDENGYEINTPAPVYNNIFRRIAGEETWIKIGEHVPTNYIFTDYTPGSGVDYEYMVQTWGENETFQDSAPIQTAVIFKNAIIAVAVNPELWVLLKWNPSKSYSKSYDETLMKFNSRENPVSEFSDSEEASLDINVTIRSRQELEQFEKIADSKQTLIYRDARGRRLFCTVPGYRVSDKGIDSYELNITPAQVYYREGLL